VENRLSAIHYCEQVDYAVVQSDMMPNATATPQLLNRASRNASEAIVQETYYPAFDYLRITLATAVAASHAGLLSWPQTGNLSVQIFFALSGWLIGGILLRSTPNDVPRFYFNRAARIWIPYVVAILLLISVSLLRDPVTAKWLEFVFYKFTFVYNFFGPPQLDQFRAAMPLQGTGNHFWSICSEEQFYLLAPLLIIALPAGRTAWFWLLVFLGLLCSPFWNYFAAISMGVLASILRARIGDWQSTPFARIVLLTIIILLFGATYFNFASYRILSPPLSVAVVLLLAQAGGHSNIAAFLGGVSYPLYLNHWIGLFAAHAIFSRFGMRDSLVAQLSSILIAVLVASILYVLIDKNVKANRSKYFTPSRGKIAAAVGYALVSIGLIIGLSL
jgi:peptidoglycan/LPS O-acetylase OafA/YrhL